jgi:hypothetical protein
MPTHLFCLLATGSDAAPPTNVGVDVRALVVGDVVAWVSTVAKDRLTREGRAVAAEAVRHDRVVAQALARNVTPMPATLADGYATDSDVVADVAARREEIGIALEQIAGLVEMAVIIASASHAADENAEAVAGGPGRKYLEQLRDRPARLTDVAARIDGALGSISRDTRRRIERDRIGMSHLVRRADIDHYRTVVLGFAGSAYRLVVDGPRAPYSFASFAPDRARPQDDPTRHETGRLDREK